MYLECKTCGYTEADKETEYYIKTEYPLLSEDEALEIIKEQLKDKDSFFPRYECDGLLKIRRVTNVAKVHPELCTVKYNKRKWQYEVILNKDIADKNKKERLQKYRETFPDPNDDITISRLKNPFKTIDHEERAYKITEIMRELEKDYKPTEFRYFRGDALDPSRRKEEKWGIVICKTQLFYDIKDTIESVQLENGKHYTLEVIPYTLQEKSSYIQSLKGLIKIE